ncbi:MAG: hypothetical protein CMD43_00530 [Gammaproteobacteria bacterium]|nr:hypothetical protein [Gammaproteobacteria bacterium]
MNSNYIKIARINVLIFFILVSILIIILRSFDLQHTKKEKYSNLISKFEIKEHVMKTSRGSIVDRNNIVLAESIVLDSLIVSDTKEFLKDEEGIKKLCVLINRDFRKLLVEVKKRQNRSFTYLNRYTQASVVSEIRKLNLKGVEFIKESKRYYPEGESISNLIGLTDFHDNGEMGLEKSHNKILSGEDGRKKVMRDLHGKIVKEIAILRKPIEGQKLSLTIDARLQYIAYRELKKQINEVKAKSGSIVIMDTTNGDILASASYPSYDPNNRKTYSPEKERNRVIIDSIEPASTIKPFVLAAALHSKKVNLNDNFDTNPGYKIWGNKTYEDIRNFGKLTSEGVIVKSSNIGSIMILEKINKKIFYDLLEHVGIGEKINLNFPSEVEGYLSHHSEWKKSDIRSLAQGYNCKVTPLQLAKAYSAIANNGLVVNPKLIKSKSIQIYENKKYEKEFKQIKNVIKKVVQQGSAKKAAIEGYTVGGKTGTAELYIGGSQKNKYSDKDHIALFAGITPLINPKLVIVVVIDQPQSKKHFGGYVAAPVFKKVATDSLRILKIKPDNIMKYQKKVLRKFENQDKYTLKNPEVHNVF